MAQDLQEIQFLCRVVQSLTTDNFKVEVNSEDLLDLPTEGKSSEKVVVSKTPLILGSSLFCRATLDKANRKVFLNSFYYLSKDLNTEKSSNFVTLEQDLINMVQSMTVSPKELMDTIYLQELEEDEEQEEDEESELQDCQE